MTSPVVTLVHDADVDPDAPAVGRTAVRAVLARGPNILLLRTRQGHWKFPGGGVEAAETLSDALARELREECGLVDVEVRERFVTLVELARAQEPGHTFSMTSHYHWCAGGTRALAPQLSADERDLGLTPRWLTPAEAVAQTSAVSGSSPPRWVKRDLIVLRLLTEAGDDV
jgi:ADP-ribose pyrophosphatase YjhB (NUDIX family)